MFGAMSMSINTKCQVFTPPQNVTNLLDWGGYTSNLYGLKVLENSCGDGNILTEIVCRYIKDCINHKMSIEIIKEGLENDIYGAEIDIEHIKACKKRLRVIAKNHGIVGVKWNIYHGDFLKKKYKMSFSFIFGNPPYITYKELKKDDRKFLRNNYVTCRKGKFDYCYAFIEASVKLLNSNGKLVYLIPSNIFKNEFASALRDLLHKNLTDIYDFTNRKLFEKKLTCSSIIIYDAGNQTDVLTYHNIVSEAQKVIPKNLLTKKWRFIDQPERGQNTERFGDLFHAASSIATLYNKAFLINKFIDNGDYIVVGDYKIEKSLLREAVSPRSKNYNQQEFIIFPYYYEKDNLMYYTSEKFERLFPCGVQYLKQFEEKLAERDSDNGIEWFEYGRSQALKNLNQAKLLISTLITKKVNVYLLDASTIPTSGLYITTISNYGLNVAEKILNSDAFFNYVQSIGVISNGSSYRISPKDINNYIFPHDLLL